MSILDRLNLLIRSELNDLTRSGRFDSAAGNVQASLREAKRQQIQLRRDEAKLIEAIREAREGANKWEDRAVLALRSGNEDLARQALVQKNRAMDEAERLRDQLDEHRSYLKDIERALEALEMKLDSTRGRLRAERGPTSGSAPTSESAWDAEMRRRMGSDAPRSSAGDRPHLPENLNPLEDPGTFREFDRMSSKIDSLEANIDAMRELSGDILDPRRSELEGIFRNMERKKRTDDDLSDLKKKFE